MKKITGVKHCWSLLVLVCFFSWGALSTAGCAGSTKTSTVTTESSNGVSGGGSSSVTTRKEVTTDAHPHGVIGGIFYTIGQVLIFPFKFIGSLFS